jgi:oligopeptide/dipeptide ABC transporter ATP-binding protein
MTLLQADAVSVTFPTPRGPLHAVRDVSLKIDAAETVGLVGESGCGKSTLGRALMRLEPITAGRVMLNGVDLLAAEGAALARLRADVQMVFQDPYGSLNPRRRIGGILAQPLRIAGIGRAQAEARVAELLALVGLAADAVDRYPHEFSGGQRQRIGIARALALTPKLIICDEPVSALDVSVRAQVVNLLMDLQARLGIAYLFISHDLTVVEHLCDRVLVMYLGRIVESAPRARLWRRPLHPYTSALLAAAPVADPARARARPRQLLAGELPSPLAPPAGCAFHTRCPIVQDRCRQDRPALRQVRDGGLVACHFADTGDAP